jgi:hypothetical protein
MFVNIPTRKEEGYYAHSLIGSDLMPIRSSPINFIIGVRSLSHSLKELDVLTLHLQCLVMYLCLGYDFWAVNLTFSKNRESWLYVKKFEYLSIDNHGGIS